MTPIGSGPVLLCYEGSDGARRAIEWTGMLLPGAESIVLHLWNSPALGSALAPPADGGLKLPPRTSTQPDGPGASFEIGGHLAHR
jgi:hypothetical protein